METSTVHAYEVALFCHSYLRWAVLALGAALLGRSTAGWARARGWSRFDEGLQRAFVAVSDTQLLLGLGLYFVWSPIARAFVADPAGAMRVRVLRFFGLEHAAMMILAVAVVHIARRRSKKSSPPRRHRVVALGTLLALALMASAIPWPGLVHGRPLFRAASSVRAAPPVHGERCAAHQSESRLGYEEPVTTGRVASEIHSL